MVKRANIEFVPANEPITQLVTKFGGQPVWLEAPQWPLSKATGNPMRFICQVAIDPQLFGDLPARMAYLFMTDDLDDEVYETWESDGGENALILQPTNKSAVPVKKLDTGPTLYEMVKKPGHKLLEPQPCEFTIRLHVQEDPDFVPDDETRNWDPDRSEQYYTEISGNKIGGTPGFLQADEFPDDGKWKLLLQLDDATQLPFYVNFGDVGVGYAFISEDGRTGKFLWQCA